MTAARVLVGRFGAAHGVRGDIRLISFTGTPDAIASYGPLEDEAGKRRFKLAAVRQQGAHLVARVEGVATREAAEALRNTDLYVSRDKLPPPEDEETFYHADLIGLSAVDGDGADLGRVVAVHDFGAGDILEIGPEGGQTRMVPFTRAAVPDIDLAARRVTITSREIEGEDDPEQ